MYHVLSDVRTSKILGHLGLIVDVIRARGRKDFQNTYDSIKPINLREISP